MQAAQRDSPAPQETCSWVGPGRSGGHSEARAGLRLRTGWHTASTATLGPALPSPAALPPPAGARAGPCLHSPGSHLFPTPRRHGAGPKAGGLCGLVRAPSLDSPLRNRATPRPGCQALLRLWARPSPPPTGCCSRPNENTEAPSAAAGRPGWRSVSRCSLCPGCVATATEVAHGLTSPWSVTSGTPPWTRTACLPGTSPLETALVTRPPPGWLVCPLPPPPEKLTQAQGGHAHPPSRAAWPPPPQGELCSPGPQAAAFPCSLRALGSMLVGGSTAPRPQPQSARHGGACSRPFPTTVHI